jgi:hypothetical protein
MTQNNKKQDSRTAVELQRAQSLRAAGRAEHLSGVWADGSTVDQRQRDEDQGTGDGRPSQRVTRSTSNVTMQWKGLTGGVEIVESTTLRPPGSLTTLAALGDETALVEPTPQGGGARLLPDVSVTRESSREELETVCGGDVSSPAPCT